MEVEDDLYVNTTVEAVKKSSDWRNGPAKLFFDLLGLPSEGNVDYSLVFRTPTPTSPEDEGGGGCAVYVDSYRDIGNEELDLAVQSILSPLSAGNSVEKINAQNAAVACDLPPTPNSPYDPQNGLHQEHQPDAVGAKPLFCRSMPDFSEAWPSNQYTSQRGQASEALAKIISQQEVNSAVDALVAEMGKTTGDDSDLCWNTQAISHEDDDDKHYLVSQMDWENDVIWNPTCVKLEENSVPAKNKKSRAGWIPTLTNRTFAINEEVSENTSKQFKPLLSLENDDLVGGCWEDEIIWDVDEFRERNPLPKIPYYDATDEQIIFKKPADVPTSETEKQKVCGSSSSSASNSGKPPTNSPKKVIQPHAIKSKLLLGKAGFIQWKWQMEQQELKAKERATQNGETSDQTQKVDINFNVSNDEYYSPKGSSSADHVMKITDPSFIRHSKVVSDHIPPFMTTYWTEEELRNFHRPPLRNHSNSPKPSVLYSIASCHANQVRKAKERGLLTKDGHPVLLDRPSDLTGLDGEIILVENSEEYPPLLSQVGMCSKIVNYFRRQSLRDRYAHGVPHPYGDTEFVYGQTSPFLGSFEPGQVISAIENNMYRAPIYHHSVCPQDFLLIINKNGYFLREFDSVFVGGQQCPLIEVPEPNSSRSKTFLKNLLLVYVYRKFAKFQPGSTPCIRLNELSRKFPYLFESTVKSWLKNCAEIKRIGSVTWVTMKPGCVIPEENVLKEMITPEQCCAYYSLQAAELRLKDAGCDSMLSLPERAEGSAEPTELVAESTKNVSDPNEQINQSKLVEELKAAPWNTTSAFVSASKGKCLLQVIGPADPTGCGEGFSYIRVAKKGSQQPVQEQRKRIQGLKTTSTLNSESQLSFRPGGTDADLRKLSSKKAKEILLKAGLPDKEIAKLSRWEVIDVVRTLSTERTRQGESDKGIAKFCRWKSKTNSVMNLERYREDCQRVFELQNKVLSSAEVLSSDDEEDEEENESSTVPTQADINQMGRNLEQILKEGKTAKQLAYEEEELERLELQKMMLGGIQEKDADIARRAELQKKSLEKAKKKEDDILTELIKHPGRKLQISRTFKEGGKTFLRTEIVRDPVIIAAYLKIRTTKSEEFIKDFLQKADRQQRKQDKLKEKMLLDEIEDKKVVQNTKVEKLQKKRKKEMETEYFPNKAAKVKAQRELSKAARKCGACGLLGHTRTSSLCPVNNPEKIKAMHMKSEIKKEKRGRGRPPIKRENYGGVEAVKPPTVSKQMLEVLKKNEVPGRESSSSDSSSDDDEDNEVSSSKSESSSEEDNNDDAVVIPAEDQTMVKVDGLKMVLKVPKDMVTQAQLQEQEEEEAARILLSMSSRNGSTPSAPPKRRVSQQEREFADYLVDKRYKTTAADRIRRKE